MANKVVWHTYSSRRGSLQLVGMYTHYGGASSSLVGYPMLWVL